MTSLIDRYKTGLALSIRQPWCHHILHDGKDIENRNWRTTYRGPVLIHAGQRGDGDRQDYIELPRGGIVGIVDIVDCVDDHPSRWFVGKYGFVLKDATPLELIPCNGRLGFFRPDIDMKALKVIP